MREPPDIVFVAARGLPIVSCVLVMSGREACSDWIKVPSASASVAVMCPE
ncbi:MAG: hypothetical protein ACKERG_03485 [Candidatus Hodgkinia cicadicola]